MKSGLDEQVRQIDEDRWLASRFAPTPVRPRLVALYAVNFEIAKTASAVREGALGDIRLAWWSENVAKALNGLGGHDHPALEALARAHEQAPLQADAFAAMIAAREKDMDEAPFAAWSDLEIYIDATAGALVDLAIDACGPTDFAPRQREALVRSAGRAWGYAGLARSVEAWTQRRSTFFPASLLSHVGLTQSDLFNGVHNHAMRSAVMSVVDRSRNYYRQAQDLAALAPSTLFPAFGYIALLRGYLRGLSLASAGGVESKRRPLIERQLTLVAASAIGRV
ncbi:MAG: hypothetical protein GC189_14300 [Alphaproteobacteria bacterium]|nr:hypothetical protein [Alphaproteobacteria bacterium]